jgi:hypothetical protein
MNGYPQQLWSMTHLSRNSEDQWARVESRGWLSCGEPPRTLPSAGHENILKRQLVHVGAFSLNLILRKLLGAGTPRELKNRAGEVFWRLLRFQAMPDDKRFAWPATCCRCSKA